MTDSEVSLARAGPALRGAGRLLSESRIRVADECVWSVAVIRVPAPARPVDGWGLHAGGAMGMCRWRRARGSRSTPVRPATPPRDSPPPPA